eukprot:CAMPEP_0116876106 /NCGR_PEP_ID=MMETSP0463-20121206/8135_1 /TAXON_ID=181622 /ORGANISM="Strombidinopsis sp, Strain SopsisLIS2011" /LENGTH=109 /DNA_ID=CAMNT_0004522553 /DNA_START=793 /DNA_END=1122 /DNA_ORIENTATION=+
MAERAKNKTQALYDYIDNSNGYYISKVNPKYRSRLNVPFRIMNDKNLEAKFIKEAYQLGLIDIKGHVSTGGIRASIYNAMPMEGVAALVDFMKKFKAQNPQGTNQSAKL